MSPIGPVIGDTPMISFAIIVGSILLTIDISTCVIYHLRSELTIETQSRLEYIMKIQMNRLDAGHGDSHRFDNEISDFQLAVLHHLLQIFDDVFYHSKLRSIVSGILIRSPASMQIGPRLLSSCF